MQFADLVRECPELEQIKREAKGWRDDDNPEMWDRYESLKARMKRCVGWKARKGLPEFMYTMQAFDIAAKEIFG